MPNLHKIKQKIYKVIPKIINKIIKKEIFKSHQNIFTEVSTAQQLPVQHTKLTTTIFLSLRENNNNKQKIIIILHI